MKNKKSIPFYKEKSFIYPVVIFLVIIFFTICTIIVSMKTELSLSIIQNLISFFALIITGITLFFLYKTLKQQQEQIDDNKKDSEFNRALDIINNSKSIEVQHFKGIIEKLRALELKIDKEENTSYSYKRSAVEYFQELINKGYKNSLSNHINNLNEAINLVNKLYNNYFSSITLFVKIIYNDFFNEKEREMLIYYFRSTIKINGLKLLDFEKEIYKYWNNILADRQTSDKDIFEYYFDYYSVNSNWDIVNNLLNKTENKYYFLRTLFNNENQKEDIDKIKTYFKVLN